MSVIVLVMAGGEGKRIRRSIGPIPKPLLSIRGVPLIERNIMALLRQDLRNIVVSVPASLPEIKRFALARGRLLVEAAQGTLEVIEEQHPRGNVGSASELRGRADVVLVVFADNLTTLDLRLFLGAHQSSGASLTLATHIERVQLPFGEVESVNGQVIAYREKPFYSMLIGSGICALGDKALAAIPSDEPMNVSDLAQALRGQEETIIEYRHNAPWVDVNDAGALGRAEALVATHQDAFEF